MTSEILRDIISGIRVCVQAVDEKNLKDKFTDKDYGYEARKVYPVKKGKRKKAFEMKDYSPHVFADIRKTLKVTSEAFLKSWEIPEAAEMKESTARSGSLFYKTPDNRYLFKTILHPEVSVMMELLKDYHNHIRTNSRTFMVKIYGLFRLGYTTQKIWVLVMGNTFPPGVKLDYVYDLKGRKPKPGKSVTERGVLSTAAHKDNEINRRLLFRPQDKQFYLEQITKDIELLKRHNIMDYSLLVGIHIITPEEKEQMKPEPNLINEKYAKKADKNRQKREKKERQKEREKDGVLPKKSKKEDPARTTTTTSHSDTGKIQDDEDKGKNAKSDSESDVEKENKTKKSKRESKEKKVKSEGKSDETDEKQDKKEKKKSLQEESEDGQKKENAKDSKKPQKKEKVVKDEKKDEKEEEKGVTIWDLGGLRASTYNSEIDKEVEELVWVGIIDNLTAYTFNKQLAHFFKSFLWDSETLSTVRSEFYAERFTKFMTKNLLADEEEEELESDEEKEFQERLQAMEKEGKIPHAHQKGQNTPIAGTWGHKTPYSSYYQNMPSKSTSSLVSPRMVNNTASSNSLSPNSGHKKKTSQDVSLQRIGETESIDTKRSTNPHSTKTTTNNNTKTKTQTTTSRRRRSFSDS